MHELHLFVDRDVMRVTLLGVPDHPGVAAEIFGALGDQGVNIDLIVSSGRADRRADISLAVQESRRAHVVAALKDIATKVRALDTAYNLDVGLVGITGSGLVGQPGVAARLFRAVSGRGINVDLVSTSLASVICMVHRLHVDDAADGIRREFGFTD